LQEKQQQRLIPKFDDQENKKLNKSIKEISTEMTQELKQCQNILKEIIDDKDDLNDINNFSELNITNAQIKQNMKQNLITKLNDFTKKFKLNQELYNNKFQDFVIDEEMANKSFSIRKNEEKNSNDFLSTQENNDQLQRRDEDLTNLLKSVNELAQIFKDMQTLVMEQGTILDRIDYNIDIASSNISKGKKNITKADKHMKNNCFRNVIIILIVIIFIEALLLVFKIF
jgi:syntaxin 16